MTIHSASLEIDRTNGVSAPPGLAASPTQLLERVKRHLDEGRKQASPPLGRTCVDARQLAPDCETGTLQHELRLQLEHANRLSTIGQLADAIAHELNEPLSATVSYANAARRWLKVQPPDLQETKDALEAIVRSGARAAEIVKRVRAMAQDTHAEADDVRINQEIDGVLAVARDEAARHRVTMRTELAPELAGLRGDRVQLQQLLLNLILNAIEAMATVTEGPRELVVRTEPLADGGAKVSVLDTGPGIPPQATDHVFEPFHTAKPGGMGMGLTICASIVESHGGRLWVTPNAPRGAVFQVTLPASRPA